MSLYKDILMYLEDDKIGKQLKESFCSLSSVVSDEYRKHYQNIRDISAEQKAKEEYFNQTIKELKDEILKHNSREEYLNQTKEIIKNAKGNNTISLLEELNKSNNDNYKALNQAIDNLNAEIKTIRMCLEESKQHNIENSSPFPLTQLARD
jgi:hypothetical protein